MPEFDKAAFMKKEIEGARAALVTIGYALLVGLVSYYLTLLGVGYLAALLGLAALYGLRYLYPRLKLDVSKFDRKTWAGNGAIFLFAWLAFWVLFLNPPFLDISPPVIQAVEVPGGNPALITPGSQTMLSLNGTDSFEIRVNAVDNTRVAKVEIFVDDSGAVTMTPAEEPGWYSHTVTPVQEGKLYVIRVKAFDHQGRESDTFEFGVTPS